MKSDFLELASLMCGTQFADSHTLHDKNKSGVSKTTLEYY